MKKLITFAIFFVMLPFSSYAQFSPDLTISESAVNAFPVPPAENSVDDKSDLKTVLSFQKTRTPDDCKRAGVEVNIGLDTYYGKPYGTLSDEEVNHWKEFFEKVKKSAKTVTILVKSHFKRPRPYVNHKDVKPCLKLEETDAYPSGHSTNAYLFAKILEKIHPDKSKEYYKRADQIALDRVVGGVHYPHDIQAGKKMADIVFNLLQKNEDYKKEFAELKK